MYFKRLRELREDNNLSQKQVAEILSLKQQAYFRYEKGISTIPIDLLIILCKYYNVTSDYILELD